MLGRNPIQQRTHKITSLSGSHGSSPDGRMPPPPPIWGEDNSSSNQDPSYVEYILCHLSDMALLALMVMLSTILVITIAQVKGMSSPLGSTSAAEGGSSMADGNPIYRHSNDGVAVTARDSPSGNSLSTPRGTGPSSLGTVSDVPPAQSQGGSQPNRSAVRKPWGAMNRCG